MRSLRVRTRELQRPTFTKWKVCPKFLCSYLKYLISLLRFKRITSTISWYVVLYSVNHTHFHHHRQWWQVTWYNCALLAEQILPIYPMTKLWARQVHSPSTTLCKHTISVITVTLAPFLPLFHPYHYLPHPGIELPTSLWYWSLLITTLLILSIAPGLDPCTASWLSTI